MNSNFPSQLPAPGSLFTSLSQTRSCDRVTNHARCAEPSKGPCPYHATVGLFTRVQVCLCPSWSCSKTRCSLPLGRTHSLPHRPACLPVGASHGNSQGRREVHPEGEQVALHTIHEKATRLYAPLNPDLLTYPRSGMSGCHGDEDNVATVGTRFIASSQARLCRARHTAHVWVRTAVSPAPTISQGWTGHIRRSGIHLEVRRDHPARQRPLRTVHLPFV